MTEKKSEVKFPRDPKAKITDCLCPLCRKIHQRKMHWIGRGIPRKYCYDCLDLLNKYRDHPSIDHFVSGRSIRKKMPEKQDTKIYNWRQDH